MPLSFALGEAFQCDWSEEGLLISVGSNRYSVPYEYAGKWVSSRLYPTRIEVVADDALLTSHARLLDRDQVSLSIFKIAADTMKMPLGQPPKKSEIGSRLSHPSYSMTEC